jgi:hypothetical protein
MEILESLGSNKFNIHVHVITISCKRKKPVFLGTWKRNVIVFDCLTWSFLVKWRFNLVQITDSLLYDTCTKVNKCNAKRGISPCLKIWPGDFDLWPWKSIGFQILLRTKYVPSLVKIHWRMLILECSQGCYAVIRKEEMIMGHCCPIITTVNGPFQCSLCEN